MPKSDKPEIKHKQFYYEMTPEQNLKSDLDLETIGALTNYAKEFEDCFIITGGYAIDAHLGGKITRSHEDIDGNFIINSARQQDEVFKFVENALVNEMTKWEIKSKDSKKAVYLEDDGGKEYKDKRRLELKLYESFPADLAFQEKQLINSKGKSYKVNVVEINELIALKIHKFYVMKDGVDTVMDRNTKESDITDLKQLMECPDFKRNKVIETIKERYLTFISDFRRVEDQAQEEFEYILMLTGVK